MREVDGDTQNTSASEALASGADTRERLHREGRRRWARLKAMHGGEVQEGKGGRDARLARPQVGAAEGTGRHLEEGE